MIIVIVGPTGVGKTRVSIELAKRLNTEIISGDSVQVYKGLTIGSAKVTEEEKEGIKHHMIDILNPQESFSVALYQRYVREAIKTIESQGKIPIIVGGTGFYIKSTLHDFNFDQAHRDAHFDVKFESYSNEELHDLLKRRDEKASKLVHPNNRHRVLQSLFRAEQGVKRSEQSNQEKPLYDYRIIGLTMPKEKLYERINQRVEMMFHQGLVEEVKHLYDANIHTQATQAIGYKELYQYFNQEVSLEEAKEAIKKHSRQYAKRQYTYFKNQFNVKWFNVDLSAFNNTIDTVIEYTLNEIHKGD